MGDLKLVPIALLTLVDEPALCFEKVLLFPESLLVGCL